MLRIINGVFCHTPKGSADTVDWLIGAELNFLWRQQAAQGGNIKKAKEAPARTPRKPRATKGRPSSEEIQRRAYELYLERGGGPGDALDDWVRAERELSEKQGPKSRKRARPPKDKIA